jgi:hypothetical protein
MAQLDRDYHSNSDNPQSHPRFLMVEVKLDAMFTLDLEEPS